MFFVEESFNENVTFEYSNWGYGYVADLVLKSTEEILTIIKEQPHITIIELCKQTGLSDKGVRKNLDKLKKEGLLLRVGPDKGGYWKIIQNE